MTVKTSMANIMRRIGLSGLVDSARFRSVVGAPVYNYQRKSTKTQPVPVRTDSEDKSKNRSEGEAYKHRGPTLTVVVPAYNVAEYLASCLDSILGQSYSNLDVLVVNDGSTDSTGEIADLYARNHRRLRVIHQRNAGLGAARNTGLENSDSKFITFVDSDDTVPSGAYERAMESLLISGSDVCIGSVSRFDSKNRWSPFWVHLAHSEDKISTTGQEFPPIMWDVFAWNKVFVRSTWDRLVGKFPESTLYEDQECTAKLFVGGAKLDILREVAYNWRLRDDNSSITQQKTDINDLSQRLSVIFRIQDIISASSEEYIQYWFTKTLGEDLFFYIREIPRASDVFYELLNDAVARLWDDAPAASISAMHPLRRLLAYYVAHRDRRDIIELLVQMERTNNAFRGVVTEDGLEFQVDDSEGAAFDIPSDLRSVSPAFLSPSAVIDSYDSDSDGTVYFGGYGFLRHLDAEYGYSADLYDTSTDSIIATLEVHNVDGETPADTSDFYNNYRGRRFRISVSPYTIDSLSEDLRTSQSSNYTLRLHLHVGEYVWTAKEIRRDVHSFAGYPPASVITDRGARLAVQGDPGQKTELVVLKPTIFASDIETDGEYLNIRLARSGPPENQAIDELYASLIRVGQEICRAPFTDHENGSIAQMRVPTEQYDASRCIDQFDLQIVSSSGRRWALGVNESQTNKRRDSDVAIGMTGFGFAVIERPLQAASADKITVSEDGDNLTVSGTYALEQNVARTITPTFALVGARRIIHPRSTSVDHGSLRFQVEFPLVLPKSESDLGSTIHDRYVIQLLLATGKSHPAAAWVAAERSLQRDLPEEVLTSTCRLSIGLIGTSRSIRVDVSDRLDSRSELGRHNQAVNSKIYIAPRRSLMPNSMHFESFSGTAVADSPLAIDRVVASQLPEVTRSWTVRNPNTPVPPGAQAVVFGSQAWYEATSKAQILVNNNNFPHYFRKHPGQFYLQTWHGTPLKRIGNHVPPKNLSLSYRQLMVQEAGSYWDLLLAQSEEAAQTLRAAFDYAGPTFAKGYPRNDALSDVEQQERARLLVRSLLRIPSEHQVILYAPTWRDNLKERNGHYSAVDFLDVNLAAKTLGRPFTVLYRGHSNSLNAGKYRFGKGVIDVSQYPDINEIIAASDLLVTDYSSVMFDYVVTGKPIIFLCPDLEEYRDSVRGFYFDFEELAPGPIVKSNTEAIDLIASGQLFSVRSTERYANFVNRFAGSDDGAASQRLVNEISHLID